MPIERVRYIRKTFYPHTDYKDWFNLHPEFEVVSTIETPYKYNPNQMSVVVYYKERT